MLAVAIVLWERVVFEHVSDCALVNIDQVGLFAVLVVLFGAATVVFHLVEVIVDAKVQANDRYHMRVITVTFAA